MQRIDRRWIAESAIARIQSAAARVITRIANDSRRTQWAFEVGGEVRMFDTPIRIAHAEGSMTSPSLLVAGGYRYDSRLRASGELSDLGLRRAEERWYARVMFDPLRYIDPRQAGDPPKLLDVGFGVEVDGPISRKGAVSLPVSTRRLIRGSLNLLGGGDSGDKE